MPVAKRHDEYRLTSFHDGDVMAMAGQICRTLQPFSSVGFNRSILPFFRLALIGSRV
ncbi:hypothetical protein AGR7A_Lc100033 [Agrobacterium deltaense NCPPB 1641]|uniref:Uncharacterized protein n=1 Tax=Agrobacterium deltaense NCPPB 1641 TaxID=1183425 RepID=A0A1S7TSY3_9HYPH|nr:hypothetical protein AGR7A_Lc100033 [Agrobacterium deltaense NCPPB 1641]